MASVVHHTSGALRVASRKSQAVEEHQEKTVDQILASAEQCFVRNDFHQALHLANQVLAQEAGIYDVTSSSSSTAMPFALRTEVPYLDETYKLSLVFEGDVSRADRAGAIVLQSHREDNELALKAFLDYYAIHAIPIDLFSILIQFFLQRSNKYRPIALELTIEGLCQIKKHFNNKAPDGDMQEATDEVVFTLLIRMLPYCPNVVYVQQIIGGGEEVSEFAGASGMKKWQTDPVPSIVDCLPGVIDSLTDIASEECLNRCREEVQKMKGTESNSNNDVLKLVSSAEDRQLGPKQTQASPALRVERWNWLDTNSRNDWYRLWSSKFLRLVKERIMAPLFQSERRWQNRGEVAMTVLSLYIAWKQKKRLFRAGGILTGSLLAPLRELVEAVSVLEQ
jgi:hypothetical protein